MESSTPGQSTEIMQRSKLGSSRIQVHQDLAILIINVKGKPSYPLPSQTQSMFSHMGPGPEKNNIPHKRVQAFVISFSVSFV